MKKVLGLTIFFMSVFLLTQFVYADMTDKATLGGQDSSNNYSWRVDTNSNLIPGTTAQNNIGSSTNQVNNVYAGSFVAAGTVNGSVSQVSSVAALPLSYGVVEIPLTNAVGAVYTLANGTPGQQICFVEIGAVTGSDTARITPSTATGFSYASLTAIKQSVTLEYINSSVGWVITGNAGATIA